MIHAPMTAEEVELDREWRARFGQPLPMLGCADIVRRILLLPDSAATPA
ncbi:DNA methylase [Brevundimonas sp. Root1423]|nr:DNA methylase [Brevundimonas sp. Root1423]